MSKTDVALERKSQIVDATVACIAKHGHHNFSMQDVAKKAGVSKGIIHYYFLNKDDLMMSVLEKVANDIRKSLKKDMSTISCPIKKLEFFLATSLNIVRNTREYYQVNMDFWTQVNQKEQVRDVITNHYLEFRETCSAVIQSGINSGQFAKTDPATYSSFIIAIIDGISLQWLFDQSAFDYDKMSVKVTSLVMNGLSVKNSS